MESIEKIYSYNRSYHHKIKEDTRGDKLFLFKCQHFAIEVSKNYFGVMYNILSRRYLYEL